MLVETTANQKVSTSYFKGGKGEGGAQESTYVKGLQDEISKQRREISGMYIALQSKDRQIEKHQSRETSRPSTARPSTAGTARPGTAAWQGTEPRAQSVEKRREYTPRTPKRGEEKPNVPRRPYTGASREGVRARAYQRPQTAR